MRRRATYWEWIESEAAQIESDGCSHVSGLFVQCCWVHDCEFFYAKDSIDAYRRWREHGDSARAWREAKPITFSAANRRFKKCHRQRTKLGAFWWINPLVWIRWRGVERLARGTWDEHRARERQAQI